MYRAQIVRFRETCSATVRLSYIVSAVVRVYFKVLMQPDKRKFSCAAAICKDMMYKTVYVDRQEMP